MSMGGEFVAGGGSAQLMSALSLLADPAKFQQRLDQLKTAEEVANAALARANIAGDVTAALAQAEQAKVNAHALRNEAQEALTSASLRAKRLVEEAELNAKLISEGADAYRRDVEAQVATQLEALAVKVAEGERASSELLKRSEELARERKDLEETAADLKRFEEALTAEKAQITEAQKRIAAAVDALRA